MGRRGRDDGASPDVGVGLQAAPGQNPTLAKDHG